MTTVFRRSGPVRPAALDLLRCPDCRGRLADVEACEQRALLCPTCVLVFPAREGIYILLERKARHARLERPLVETLASLTADATLRAACERTLGVLDGAPESCAWEDEAHWSAEYLDQLGAPRAKNWNDRHWQREPAFRLARERLGAPGPQVVVDVGCGEGQDFRAFLADALGPDDLYVALEISLPGLLLNRAQNPHKRALYVLGSAESVPLPDRCADVVLCLGVIHHMEHKASGLGKLARLLRDGLLILNDPINGHMLPARLRRTRRNRSAHDGTLDYAELRRQIERAGLDVCYERQHSGLVYFTLMRLLRPVLLRRRGLHAAAHGLDDTCNRIFGRFLPPFRPRALVMALGPRDEAHPS